MAKWEFFKGHKDNWFSEKIYNWMDPSDTEEFKDYPLLKKTCVPERIREILFPFVDIMLLDINYYPAGSCKEKGKPILDNVPAFYQVRLKEILSGQHVANIRIFLPVRWNRRFMGIAGAGSNLETDWDKEQTTNITSWPMAVRNGFACVVNDGATGMFVDASWGF